MGKARSLPHSGAPERCFIQVGCDIRLGWRDLSVTNTKAKKLECLSPASLSRWAYASKDRAYPSGAPVLLRSRPLLNGIKLFTVVIFE